MVPIQINQNKADIEAIFVDHLGSKSLGIDNPSHRLLNKKKDLDKKARSDSTAALERVVKD